MDDNVKNILEALRFYAKPEHYTTQEKSYMCHGEPHFYKTSEITDDKGEKARECLKNLMQKIKKKTKNKDNL